MSVIWFGGDGQLVECLECLRWTSDGRIRVMGGYAFPMIGDSGEQVDQLQALGRVQWFEQGVGLLGEGCGGLALRLRSSRGQVD